MLCCSPQALITYSIKQCCDLNSQKQCCLPKIKSPQKTNPIIMKSPKHGQRKSLKKSQSRKKIEHVIGEQSPIKMMPEYMLHRREKTTLDHTPTPHRNTEVRNSEFCRKDVRYMGQPWSQPRIRINLINSNNIYSNIHSNHIQSNHQIINNYERPPLPRIETPSRKLTPSSTFCTSSEYEIRRESVLSGDARRCHYEIKTNKSIENYLDREIKVQSSPEIKKKIEVLSGLNPKQVASEGSEEEIFQDEFSEVVERYLCTQNFIPFKNI